MIRMHLDEVATDATLVSHLLGRQFPQWSGFPVVPVDSFGTDHAIYRLGEHLAARLPRIGWAVGQSEKESHWLPQLAPELPLTLPVPLAIGQPDLGFPYPWAVYEWLPGEPATGTLPDGEQTAVDLAGFIRALRGVDPTGGPAPGGRGGPLADQDDAVLRAVSGLGDRIDRSAALRSWEESLAAPPWEGPPTWVHGDLLPGNLLLRDRHLSAVIDFGALAVGDPACDLQPAWHLFDGSTRDVFFAELDTDDDSRVRGRGWVLYQAVTALRYYWETNPGIVAQSWQALAAVLGDR
jgi:aminoglycoside phosphotransferase (APT) family kinase protein